jgi:hypothetical protein
VKRFTKSLRSTAGRDGDGDTFASKGILIEVFVKNSSGAVHACN